MTIENKINYYSYSVTGPRKENEDFCKFEFWKDKCIISIADGVGGRNCGSTASRYSVNNFHEMVKQNISDLNSVIEKVHQNLLDFSIKKPNCIGLASTFTGCIIYDNQISGVHVGDTRLCILRGNGIKELTFEHSEAAKLYRNRLISKEQYFNYPRKNIIESALGIEGELIRQTFSFRLSKGDRLILSTDGFHNTISKIELRDYSINFSNLKNLKDFLIEQLCKRKLTDNTSFVIFEIL